MPGTAHARRVKRGMRRRTKLQRTEMAAHTHAHMGWEKEVEENIMDGGRRRRRRKAQRTTAASEVCGEKVIA